MIENSLVPANEIWYTTTDGKTIKGRMDTPKKSNTYKQGKGVIVFQEPVVEIGEKAFYDCSTLQEMFMDVRNSLNFQTIFFISFFLLDLDFPY